MFIVAENCDKVEIPACQSVLSDGWWGGGGGEEDIFS